MSRILLVDDEPSVLFTLSQLLKSRGIDVLSVVAPIMDTETLRRQMGARGLSPSGLMHPGEVVRRALSHLSAGPTCAFPTGFDGPPEMLETARRERVLAVTAATKMFFGD